MLTTDPLTRLFDMHIAHGQTQLRLAHAMLERQRLRASETEKMERLRKKEDDELDRQVSALSDEISKLDEKIKEALHLLTGIPFDSLQDAISCL